MSIMKADHASVPCDCCGQPTPRTYAAQEGGFCATCRKAGCYSSAGDGNGGMQRLPGCPLLAAVVAVGADVCMCLQCSKPLHRSEPLNFVDNSNPGLGGVHARCVDAYHAARRALNNKPGQRLASRKPRNGTSR